MLEIKMFFIVLIFIALMDFIWLGLISKNIYFSEMKPIVRTDGKSIIPNWPAALLVYHLLALAVVLFILPAISNQESLVTKVLVGAFMGLIIYGVYDLTNYAILEKFTLKIALIDMAWGTISFGLTTLFTTYILPLLK